jgi:hypothetical protein
MTFATGVAKQLKYKVESVWGTIPAAGSAQLLRRVTSTLGIKKQTYESNEINPTYQRNDFRHGMRSAEGTITDELSPGTYKDWMAAAVRRAFTTVTAITGASITIAGSGPTWTITRAAGSFLSDGIKQGYIVRLTAGAFNAANLNKNLIVNAVTSATVLTVSLFPGVAALVAEGPIVTATVTVPGKVTFVPSSGHTDLSYSIEHWHLDLSLSEVFSGCKMGKMNLNLPPTGMATVAFDIIGRDTTNAGAEYFTSPTAATTTGVTAAVNGALVAQSGLASNVTSLSIALDGNMTTEPIVGSNVYGDITEGRILLSGQMTAVFQDAVMRDYFLNETEVSLFVALSASSAVGSDFLSFALPRIKFGAADRDDGDKALIITLPFTALYNFAGGAGVQTEQTTFQIQDSQA